MGAIAQQISIEAAQPSLDFATLDGLGGKTVILGIIGMAADRRRPHPPAHLSSQQRPPRAERRSTARIHTQELNRRPQTSSDVTVSSQRPTGPRFARPEDRLRRCPCGNWVPGLRACNQISAGVPSLLFRRSRESGNLGISVTCPGPPLSRGRRTWVCVELDYALLRREDTERGATLNRAEVFEHLSV
jgi:hypothetical protein